MLRRREHEDPTRRGRPIHGIRVLARLARAPAALAASALLVLPAGSAAAGSPSAAGHAAGPGTSLQEAPPAEGQWSGAIQVPEAALEVVVDLAPAGGGPWTGRIDIPAQGVEDRELGGVEAGADSVRFSIPGIPGSPTFRGEVTADGDSLTGDFSQGGRTFPFGLARVGPAEVAAGPDPREALEGFDALVEEALEAFRVPGAAVAVVADGEVVLSRGYGVRDRESGAAVTDSTLFPVGSMTKSFTSLLVGDLVEEGLLSWEEPVRTWLPEFRLEGDFASNHATPVDLLSHRTGLPRHDLLWIAWEEADTTVTRADYLRDLRHLPPTAEFRTEWQYNNFMYVAAGYLAGRVTGSSWEEQVRRRFLEPLGMRRTALTVEEMASRPDHASGYRVVRPDSGQARTEPMDYFRIDAMAPAGAINSSASEMTRWLRLHLNGGEVEGERVVPAAAVERTHRRVMPLQGGISGVRGPEVSLASYALGWQVQSYRGHRMLQHGGGIDGFSSNMAILPGEELGVVVLSNRLGSAFTTAVTLSAVDRVLGLEGRDWVGRFRKRAERSRESAASSDAGAARAGAPPTHPLEEYAGSYRHPAYGTVRISVAGGDTLRAELGALSVELAHRHYDVFDGTVSNPLLEELGFAFQFEADRTGEVTAVTVPTEPSADPVRFERLPPERMRDPAFLERLTGAYRVAGMEVEVRLRGDGTLVFEQPGASAELIPERDARFRVEDREGLSVEFLLEDGGEATGVVIRQAGRRFEGERVPEDSGDGSPDGGPMSARREAGG